MNSRSSKSTNNASGPARKDGAFSCLFCHQVPRRRRNVHHRRGARYYVRAPEACSVRACDCPRRAAAQPPHHTLGDIALDHNLAFRFADITQVNHPTLSASMKCLGRLENLAYGSSASRIFPETVHPNVVNSSIVSSPSTSAPMDILHNRALAA